MDLVKGMVLGENRSYMTDTHFAELEGIREESTLLLRNFYKVCKKNTKNTQCSKIGKKCNFKSAKKTLFAFSKMAKNQFLHQKKVRK